MIASYLDAAIRQARERAKLLKTKIPRPVKAPELIPLQRLCENSLDIIINRLDYLLEDAVILLPEVVKERFRLFRRALGALAQVETTGISALNRVHDDDIFLNRLVFQIHQEINFPLAPPTVSCLSRDYFSINTSLQLLEVPLAESDFLLHLPDLYHEIGHLLIATTNNPKVEPFQKQLGKFLLAVDAHFDSERVANTRATGPTNYFGKVLDLLERYWIEWATEIFCDLFAIYTLGPAYAWAHFHLTASHEGDPYDMRLARVMSHPPDQARMESMLIALELLGFKSGAEDVHRQWAGLVKAIGAVQTSMYRKACPLALLEQAAIHAFEGTKAIGCRVACKDTADRIHILLNGAWEKFWASPVEYEVWERDCMVKLKRTILTLRAL